MKGSTMFNAIAHATTLYYYVHILRTIAGMRAAPAAGAIVKDFMDLRPKYFTMWGVAMQAMLFAMCVLHDAMRVFAPSNALRRAVRYTRDLALVGFAAPAALTVSAMFWSLYTLDRELVMPTVLDSVVPNWLNHAMHTFVVVLVVVQMLAEPHHPPSKTAIITVSLAFITSYNCTFFHEYLSTGRWIYPIFGLLDWPGRIALIAFTSAMFMVLSLVLRAFIKARWGPAPKISSKATKKRN